MAPVPEAQLARFAERHHGVFNSGHAALVGMTHQQMKDRVQAGLWDVLLHATYRTAGAPITWKGWLLAACWAGGFRAVASHRSAAALHGLAGGRTDIAEITCPRWRRARHPGVQVHETKALDAIDITVVDGIPVTTPERTLLDLGAVGSPLVVRMAFDKARNTGLVTTSRPRRRCVALPGPGGRASSRCGPFSCRGVRPMRRRRARWRR
jgi:hypothetical protein